MRKVVVLVALSAFACASSPVQQCINISGSYVASGDCKRTGAGDSRFVLNDGDSCAAIRSMMVEQIGCSLKIHLVGEDGATHELALDKDLDWDDGGVAFTWKPRGSGPSIIPGTSAESRTLALSLLPSGEGLTLTSSYDQRGVALLFVPYHNHREVSCAMKRTP